ncbi:MAG: phosphotyrosine protein phosphatase [Lachnospiraceae bacterium]|nr:phosphotyrosine protein phosphatase [Lachnospiraceae bacterium]MDE6979817.1 phosphotyrosine protein phosphatase [Lachnospiraceae bacterium]
MKLYDKVIFVDENGTCRAPMAAEIFKDISSESGIASCARGLVVLFPEPMNQKTEAVMASNGFSVEGYMSCALQLGDVGKNTLVVTMEAAQRLKILEMFQEFEERQVRVLTELVGDELEIVNPYGGSLQVYGLCYETLYTSIKKLVDLIT